MNIVDMALIWNAETGTADIDFIAGDVARDYTLNTAVILSLGLDRVADDLYSLAAGEDPRGWWGDAYHDRAVGSNLWELQRAKKTDNTLTLRAEGYAREALQWMLDDGVATALQIDAQWMPRPASALQLTVVITLPDDSVQSYVYGLPVNRV